MILLVVSVCLRTSIGPARPSPIGVWQPYFIKHGKAPDDREAASMLSECRVWIKRHDAFEFGPADRQHDLIWQGKWRLRHDVLKLTFERMGGVPRDKVAGGSLQPKSWTLHPTADGGWLVVLPREAAHVALRRVPGVRRPKIKSRSINRASAIPGRGVTHRLAARAELSRREAQK